jgi:hypothetical protein
MTDVFGDVSLSLRRGGSLTFTAAQKQEAVVVFQNSERRMIN